MPKNMSMPRLSDTMEVGTIVKWHVKPGQKVKSGQSIADIETDKATMELQTFDDGVVGELTIAEGKSCPVGQTILKWEGGDSAAAPAQRASNNTTDTTTSDTATNSAATNSAATNSAAANASNGVHSSTALAEPAVPRERVFASPLARKIAADNGLELADIEGSGPSGRIIRKDVEAALAASATSPPRTTPPPTSPTRSPPSPATAAPSPIPPLSSGPSPCPRLAQRPPPPPPPACPPSPR